MEVLTTMYNFQHVKTQNHSRPYLHQSSRLQEGNNILRLGEIWLKLLAKSVQFLPDAVVWCNLILTWNMQLVQCVLTSLCLYQTQDRIKLISGKTWNMSFWKGYTTLISMWFSPIHDSQSTLFSISLSLSHTHTHTCACTRARKTIHDSHSNTESTIHVIPTHERVNHNSNVRSEVLTAMKIQVVIF